MTAGEDGGELESLLARRAARHRLGGPRIGSLDELASFVDERRLVLWTGRGEVASLPEAIAGRALSGSWWSQPEAVEIYALLEQAEDDGLFGHEALTAPLVAAKSCAVAPVLATAVSVVAHDEGRLERCAERRSPAAAALLARVVAEGALRMDDPRLAGASGRRARLELEHALVARSRSVHTDAGRHTAVLETFDAGPFPARSKAPPGDYAAALGDLAAAALHSAVVAPERAAARWLAFEPDGGRRAAALAGALEAHGGRRLAVGRTTWVSLLALGG